MIELTIDATKVSVPEGTTVLEAAARLNILIPHFCYHKKLSIAANCRMCLVEVEKVPKPVPACATPVTEGMKIYTPSVTGVAQAGTRSEEHTSELQSLTNLVCRLLLEKKKAPCTHASQPTE